MDQDPTDLQAQRRSEQERRERFEVTSRQEQADLSSVMATEAGRRVVHRLLERAGVNRSSFSTNAMQMAFAEGARNEGLRLLAQVASLPEYALMLQEAREGQSA
jgi:ribosomal protein L18